MKTIRRSEKLGNLTAGKIFLFGLGTCVFVPLSILQREETRLLRLTATKTVSSRDLGWN